jgi:hypothetical protein
MNGRTNPFLYGRPLDSGEGLLGRDAELEQLLGCVRSGRAVMVYGPGRTGKRALRKLWRVGRVVQRRIFVQTTPHSSPDHPGAFKAASDVFVAEEQAFGALGTERDSRAFKTASTRILARPTGPQR